MDYTKMWDLEVCSDINMISGKKIILWGAAAQGIEVLKLLKKVDWEIIGFCDSDVEKWGTMREGLEIISPYKLKEKYQNEDLCIILCMNPMAQKNVLRLLGELHIDNCQIMTYWGIKNTFWINADTLLKNNPNEKEAYKLEEGFIYNDIEKYTLNKLKCISNIDDDIIWLLQSGKVASSTLNYNFDRLGKKVYHQHFLGYPEHILHGKYKNIWESALDTIKRKKIKIVTAVREPIGRDYSAFWQPFSEGNGRIYLMPILNRNFQDMYTRYTNLLLAGLPDTIEELQEATPGTWCDEFEWFNHNLKEYLGIDIYSYPFDREKGYEIIRQNNCEIFIYKVEKLNGIISDLLMFIEANRDFVFKNVNVADNKWYALAYSAFRQRVRLSKEYVDHYYDNNKFVNHFYSKEEQNQFIDKWIDNIS